MDVAAEPPEPHRAAEPPLFALVSCFDKRDELVEVSMNLLKPFDCRLAKVIQHQDPDIEQGSGRRYWRSNMTRAMLQTFLRSIEHGELSLGKNVSLAEAMSTFEYENITIGVPAERMGEMKLIRDPPAGAVFQKRAERVTEVILRTCEQVATAICRWPRLEASLDAALTGYSANCTCTANRAWVRFIRKPYYCTDKGDPAVTMAKKWPTWMSFSLTCYGLIHHRLVRDKLVDDKSRDEEAFNALQTAIQRDTLGFLMPTVHDWPRFAQDRTTRKRWMLAEAFANEMRQCILDATTPKGEREVPEEEEWTAAQYSYARGCISLAEAQLHDAPNLATMFAGQCTDDAGKSPERVQLQRSLQQRGIKVVRWSEDDRTPARPLIFPPSWAEGAGSGSNQCAMLLDFSERR